MSCARFGVARQPLPDGTLDLLLERDAQPSAVRLAFLDPRHGAVMRVPTDATAFPRVGTGPGRRAAAELLPKAATRAESQRVPTAGFWLPARPREARAANT